MKTSTSFKQQRIEAFDIDENHATDQKESNWWRKTMKNSLANTERIWIEKGFDNDKKEESRNESKTKKWDIQKKEPEHFFRTKSFIKRGQSKI